MQLVDIGRVRPGFLAYARDRRRVERTEVVGIAQLGCAPRVNSLRAALLERRVVEKAVDRRVEQLVAEQRGLRRLARDEVELSRVEPLELAREARQVHRLF